MGVKMSIVEKGFLGHESELKRVQIRNLYKTKYDLYQEINQFAHTVLNDCYAKIGTSVVKLLIVSLYIRCLTIYQSILFVSERGMLAETRILLRSIIEVCFYIKAVCKDENILNVLHVKDEQQKLRSVNRIIHSKTKIKNLPSLEELNKKKIEIEERIKNIPAKAKGTEELSELAGMHDYYLTVYTPLCNSVHTNAIDLEMYLDMENNKIIGLSYGPTDDKISLNLSTAMEVILNSMGAMNIYFELEHQIKIENYHNQLKKHFTN